MTVELLEYYVSAWRRLSASAFAENFPNSMLVLSAEADHEVLGVEDSGSWQSFHTAAHSINDLRPIPEIIGAERPVLAICKQAENPWHDLVSVGRARNNDIVLRDDSVSKLHAHFRVEGERVFIVDTGSRNGTHRNGVPLTPESEVELHTGDVLRIGRVEGSFYAANDFPQYVKSLFDDAQ